MAATAEFVVPKSMPTTFSPGATSARTDTREPRQGPRCLHSAAVAAAAAKHPKTPAGIAPAPPAELGG
eukprot:CAMPEP_0171105616 /NCGR_PEP_ID=MMETSP0766_2-20121228/63077_1 /TAXON_ID=439317 /ORGANISM="Gambierdiscus australes, Strain CAWD 149" /LENGTH=67 /DNA_ID=CAMNT_0011566521 /DNA_START=91 /DNA_END=290 /DNA_ORIENTATION=-